MPPALAAQDPLAPTRPPGQDELPCEDGEPMETPKHRQQMSLLIESLQLHLADRPDVFIGGNMAVYYSMLQVQRMDFRAPDFFVVLGVEPRERKSWVVWEEDGRGPDLVIELLSESTEANDRGVKMRVYARALRVPEYYLFDPLTCVLEGYRLDPERGEYRAMTPGTDGWLGCATLGLRLGVAPGSYQGHRTDWLRWWLPDGTVLPTGVERAAAAEARVAELEARLRAMGERERG